MTIQNWFLTPARATVVCDSLGSSPEDSAAVGMVSKCWIVPHLGVLIAAKNWMLPAIGLYLNIAHGFAAQNWHEVVARSPAILREAAAAHPAHCAEHMAECRVVVFGFDDQSGCIAGCLFQGALNFSAEPFSTLEWRMPRLADPPGGDWDHAIAQQAYDRSLPLDDMDNIGGPLIRADLMLEDGQPIITVRRLGVLPSHEAVAQPGELTWA